MTAWHNLLSQLHRSRLCTKYTSMIIMTGRCHLDPVAPAVHCVFSWFLRPHEHILVSDPKVIYYVAVCIDRHMLDVNNISILTTVFRVIPSITYEQLHVYGISCIVPPTQADTTLTHWTLLTHWTSDKIQRANVKLTQTSSICFAIPTTDQNGANARHVRSHTHPLVVSSICYRDGIDTHVRVYVFTVNLSIVTNSGLRTLNINKNTLSAATNHDLSVFNQQPLFGFNTIPFSSIVVISRSVWWLPALAAATTRAPHSVVFPLLAAVILRSVGIARGFYCLYQGWSCNSTYSQGIPIISNENTNAAAERLHEG